MDCRPHQQELFLPFMFPGHSILFSCDSVFPYSKKCFEKPFCKNFEVMFFSPGMNCTEVFWEIFGTVRTTRKTWCSKILFPENHTFCIHRQFVSFFEKKNKIGPFKSKFSHWILIVIRQLATDFQKPHSNREIRRWQLLCTPTESKTTSKNLTLTSSSRQSVEIR